MTPCPLNEEDFRIRYSESERLPNLYVRQQYESIRDAIEKCCLEILESKEKT